MDPSQAPVVSPGRVPTFCLPCFELYAQRFDGDEPFYVPCAHAPTCPPFPPTIEGTRLQFLSIIAFVDDSFTHPNAGDNSDHTWAHEAAERVRNLATGFVKAVGVHERLFAEDFAGLRNFHTSHLVALEPQRADPNDSEANQLYALSTTYPSLKHGDHGWKLWEAAVFDFYDSIKALIDETDEGDYDPEDKTCVDDWVRDFPVPWARK